MAQIYQEEKGQNQKDHQNIHNEQETIQVQEQGQEDHLSVQNQQAVYQQNVGQGYVEDNLDGNQQHYSEQIQEEYFTKLGMYDLGYCDEIQEQILKHYSALSLQSNQYYEQEPVQQQTYQHTDEYQYNQPQYNDAQYDVQKENTIEQIEHKYQDQQVIQQWRDQDIILSNQEEPVYQSREQHDFIGLESNLQKQQLQSKGIQEKTQLESPQIIQTREEFTDTIAEQSQIVHEQQQDSKQVINQTKFSEAKSKQKQIVEDQRKIINQSKHNQQKSETKLQKRQPPLILAQQRQEKDEKTHSQKQNSKKQESINKQTQKIVKKKKKKPKKHSQNKETLQKEVNKQQKDIKEIKHQKTNVINQDNVHNNKIELLDQQNNNHNQNNINPPKKLQNQKIDLVLNHVDNENNVIAQDTQIIPPLTSQIIMKEAEKQRVGTTYKLYLKYNHQYQKTVEVYKRVIKNVCTELERKKNQKKNILKILLEYFGDYAKLNRQFYQLCFKFQLQQTPSPTNKFANIKLQLKAGYQQMIYLRKSIANDSNRLDLFTMGTIVSNITKAFQTYYSTISQQQNRQIQRRKQHSERQKQFKKVISQVDKNFFKGLQGKEKEDLFKELCRFINQEKLHRISLRNFGRGLADLRRIYIKSQKQLFDSIQTILNKFKTQSKVIYNIEPRHFHAIQDLSQLIKSATKFTQLCTLTDLDYIKYVLEIQSKKETNSFTNRHFQDYLDLIFFDRVVGNIKDLYRGAINKIIPMERQHQELIHTISRNLIWFQRENDVCMDKFVISNLNAKVIGQGYVEFDQLLKRIFFDDNRTVRLKLKDADRAQELICFLNQKQENIIIQPVSQR